MSKKRPKQIQPLINPEPPETTSRFRYFSLNEPQSPQVAPPNAIRAQTYDAPRMLRPDDQHDNRIAYGFVEYESALTWAELEKYNMYSFDYDEGVLYDLWQLLDKDKKALMRYLTSFFGLLEGDKGANCLGLAIKLASREWTLARATTAVGELQ